MYFKEFSDIYYEFDIGGKPVLKVVKDIATNIRFQQAVLENVTLYDEYDIGEGETPDIIAAKIYGTSEYHWVIMLCNQKFDYVKDFPMESHTLNEYIASKYPNPHATHHYENSAGFVVMSDAPGAVPITNEQYEVSANDSKRRIKIISPTLLARIVEQFKTLV